jgi:hypothetical protein
MDMLLGSYLEPKMDSVLDWVLEKYCEQSCKYSFLSRVYA